MANSPQAIKRARQNTKRALHNAGLRSKMRTAIKKTLGLIEAKDKDRIKTTLTQTLSTIDKISNKGLIHKNKAARLKSRLVKRSRELLS